MTTRRRAGKAQHDKLCGPIGEYRNAVPMPLNGRVRTIDRCIAHIVAALNAGGVETVACCCGHGQMDGRIDLADGRVMVIKRWLPAKGGKEGTR